VRKGCVLSGHLGHLRIGRHCSDAALPVRCGWMTGRITPRHGATNLLPLFVPWHTTLCVSICICPTEGQMNLPSQESCSYDYPTLLSWQRDSRISGLTRKPGPLSTRVLLEMRTTGMLTLLLVSRPGIGWMREDTVFVRSNCSASSVLLASRILDPTVGEWQQYPPLQGAVHQ
jgi:hypothetical protein